jgi:hypothetical protein
LPRRCLTKTIQGKILLIPSIWCLSILVFAFQPRTNLFLLFLVMQLCPVLPPLLQGSLSCHMPVLGWSWVTSYIVLKVFDNFLLCRYVGQEYVGVMINNLH